LNGGAKHHTPDTAKTVDANFDSHVSLLRWLNSMKLCYMISSKFTYFFYLNEKTIGKEKAPVGAFGWCL
jgi:hypothetical protein